MRRQGAGSTRMRAELTSTICEAIRTRRRIERRYDGYARVVEAHACGTTAKFHAVVHVWQVRGGSVRHEPLGWKLLRPDEVRALHILEEGSEAPQLGYRHGDRAMQRIICEL